MATKSSNPYYSIYYRSHGRWIGPYGGKKYTKRGLTRQPLAGDVAWLKNYGLKARVQIRKVSV